jgi:hypothetical protein
MTSTRTFDRLLAFGRGDAVAIAAPDATALTYDGLRALIVETIASLNEIGIGRNDRVAIVLPNGPEMATAFIAIASGATSAPLNPAYRADEFEFYMSDLGAKALVVEQGSASPAIEAAKMLGIVVLTLMPDPKRAAGAFTLFGGKKEASEAARYGRMGRRRAGSAYVGNNVATENGAAHAEQCCRLGWQYRENFGVHGRRSWTEHYAVVPHPRADCRSVGAAFARRQRFLHARIQRLELLRLDGGIEADLVHGGSDDASGDLDASGAQQGRHRGLSTAVHSFVVVFAATASDR